MRRMHLAGAFAALALTTSAQAFIVSFNYTQTDSTTGSGQIAPFTFMGHNFLATNLPVPTVINPGGTGLTPAGFVAAITGQTGTGNESNAAAGLLFSGLVTATSTDGFLIDIPLIFAQKQTQTPDVNDYTWNVIYGDSAANGVDAVGSALRFAMYLSRDTAIDTLDTANLYQRYTQDTKNFVAGQDNFTNTDTTTTAIKDAMDGGDPQGTDAVGRDLSFYFGWRDGGSLTSGRILVDTFTVGGVLNATDASLRQVPEPSAALLALTGMGALALRRQRR